MEKWGRDHRYLKEVDSSLGQFKTQRMNHNAPSMGHYFGAFKSKNCLNFFDLSLCQFTCLHLQWGPEAHGHNTLEHFYKGRLPLIWQKMECMCMSFIKFSYCHAHTFVHAEDCVVQRAWPYSDYPYPINQIVAFQGNFNPSH